MKTFLIVVTVFVIIIFLLSKVKFTEKFLLKIINKSLKKDEITPELKEKMMDVLDKFSSPELASVVKFNVTGDATFIRGMYNVVRHASVDTLKADVREYIDTWEEEHSGDKKVLDK